MEKYFKANNIVSLISTVPISYILAQLAADDDGVVLLLW